MAREKIRGLNDCVREEEKESLFQLGPISRWNKRVEKLRSVNILWHTLHKTVNDKRKKIAEVRLWVIYK